jgi:hypothetical protein
MFQSRFRDQGLGNPLSKVGFPIRKSADQSSFAAPRGLSQRSTSFIASQRQGIHQMPLRHLIALIINAHPSRRWSAASCVLENTSSQRRTMIRKTSLLHKIEPTAMRSSVADIDISRSRSRGKYGRERVARDDTVTRHTRIDLLFTMSDNTNAARRCRRRSNSVSHERAFYSQPFVGSRPSATFDRKPSGGARRDRTDDLLLAKQALSQLSYGPAPVDIGWLAGRSLPVVACRS